MTHTDRPGRTDDVLHLWTATTRYTQPVTGCGIAGPVLPWGHAAVYRFAPRRAPLPDMTCPVCAHLADCPQAGECAPCQEAAAVRVRAVFASRPVDLDDDARPAAPAVIAPAPAAVDVAAESGADNPQRDAIETDGRGPVPGYRFHLVDGAAPRSLAKGCRRELHANRDAFRTTFTVSAGGCGYRSINVVPDADWSQDDPRWSDVLDIIADQLGKLAAPTGPAENQRRHAEIFPF